MVRIRKQLEREFERPTGFIQVINVASTRVLLDAGIRSIQELCCLEEIVVGFLNIRMLGEFSWNLKRVIIPQNGWVGRRKRHRGNGRKTRVLPCCRVRICRFALEYQNPELQISRQYVLEMNAGKVEKTD